MSSKQRPRPRPKPHAHKTDGAPSISPLETGPPNDPPQLKDNDDFFIKNRGFDEIKARAERNRKAEEEGDILGSDYSDESDRPSGKKKQRLTTKVQTLPSWTTKIYEGKSIFSKEKPNHSTLDGSDDELLDLTQGRKRSRSDSPSRSKRARPKSRSPTPPPPLPLHIRERARAVAREIIKDHIPHVNDIQDREMIRALNQFKDNPIEIEDDDPEVASVLRRIKAEYRPQPIRESSSPGPAVPGPGRTVKIIITWVSHPYDEIAKEQVPETWNYTIDRDSDLRDIFKNIAERKHIFLHDLVVTHEDHQIYSMKTLRQLEGLAREIHLSASEKNTHDILRELRREGKTQPEPFSIDDSEDEDTVEEVKSEAEETQIRLDLKSKPFPEAKRMNVKVTTISRAILTAYLKAVGADPAKKGVRLMFEGQSLDLDASIGSHDLELDDDEDDDDGIQIDVVGL